ncbi:interferon gamma receptor 2 isoform X2 [Molossus molossus]|uniref:Interferon gamma receptor 2 n=1 Tax=Molossus molossus TaxID=27622 RepID=A0A7J8HZD1_MOLMO|nr:interferon gamma receptor 2 isoform X2 [Molossus molossus]KAF6477693.1 interferon gamma receptor 2 [Molossus molossus]
MGAHAGLGSRRVSSEGSQVPAGPSQDQLPAPQNPEIWLYNAQQVLRWGPVSLSNETRPVAYQVQFTFPASSTWMDVNGRNSPIMVNCWGILATECDFTPAGLSLDFLGFPMHFNVSLRVRAELETRTSAWVAAPWFQHYRNVTIGPPENIVVTPGKGSLFITLSPPFNISAPSPVTFSYYVHYWENPGNPQVKGPIHSNLIVLKDLKPLTVYCLQVRAELFWKLQNIARPGHLSNETCHKTEADASTRFQQGILIAVATFLSLAGVAGSCLFVILKYRGLIKHWFHTPPGIPVQIEEYLKDPAQPILEALDDSSPKEDPWDSVSVILCPEKE